MASNTEKLQRMQAIADRNLQDKLPPAKRAIFDEALRRGMITSTGSVTPDPQQQQQENPLPTGLGEGFPEDQPQRANPYGFPQAAVREAARVRNNVNPTGSGALAGPELSTRDLAGGIGSTFGGIIGGPPGAAAGFAVGDQLAGKFDEGEEITPSGAATSLLEGAAYEFLPKAVLDTVGAGGKTAGKALYHKAFRPTGKDAAKAAPALKFGLENNVRATKSGIQKNIDIVSGLKADVDKLIKEATDAGKLIKTSDVLKSFDKNVKRTKNDWLTGDKRMHIINAAKDKLKARGPTITPVDAQAAKSELQGLLADAYNKRVKNELTRSQKATAHGLRKGLEDVAPGIGPKNKEMSNRILLNNMMAKRFASTENQALFGLNDMVMAKIAGPGGVAARRLAAAPQALSASGIGANQLGKLASGTASRIPPAAINQLLLNIASKRVRGEDN